MNKDEEWYVILNMNCKYEICRMCPKSGLFKGSYEECEKWIEQKQKEEAIDEMKNKISLAIKDSILQQGFEIICKNLAELEKENAELRKTETMLKILKDRGVIKSWYYNGSYHVGFVGLPVKAHLNSEVEK